MSSLPDPSHERVVTQFDPPVPDSPSLDPRSAPSLEPESLVITQAARAVYPSVAQSRTSYTSRFAIDTFVVAAIGLAILTTGLIAITRGGFDGTMSDPVVEVLGFRHTTTLGILEIGLGVCLLLSAFASSRPAEVFFGTMLGVAGFVGSVQAESFQKSLALESAMAKLAIGAGVIVVLAALLIPRMSTHTTRIVQA